MINRSFKAVIESPALKEIGVVDPKKRFFWLARDSIQCSGTTISGDHLSIELDHATGIYYNDNGVAETRYVFSSKGAYTILVADNLETELENSFSHKFYVEYKPNKKINSLSPKKCSL